MIETLVNYWNRPMHGLIYWRECGHLLSVNWRYKTIATLTLYHFPSAVHAGLRATLQDFHGDHELFPDPVCSESWVNVAVVFSARSCCQTPYCGFLLYESLLVLLCTCLHPVHSSILFPRGLSLRWGAKIFFLLVMLRHHRRVQRFGCILCCWW